MTDHPTSHGPQFALNYTPEIKALARIIKANFGTIPPHERARALELAERIDEDARMLDKLSFADRDETPGLRGHKP